MEEGNGSRPDRTIELSIVDLVLLGARLYALVNRGATLREVLTLVAESGDIEPEYFIESVRRVVDGHEVIL